MCCCVYNNGTTCIYVYNSGTTRVFMCTIIVRYVHLCILKWYQQIQTTRPILKLVLYIKLTATCFDQPSDHPQGHRTRRLETLKVYNKNTKNIKIAEPKGKRLITII